MGYERGASATLRQHVLTRPEAAPFSVSEVLGFGTRTAVDQALGRLVKQGVLARVTRGVYVRPRISPLVGEVPPSPEAVVSAIANAFGHVVGIHGAEAARRLGLTNQVPMIPTFLTSGRTRELHLGALTVHMRHASDRHLALAGRPAGTVLAALTYMGPAAVTDETITHVMERVPVRELEPLARSHSVPRWVRTRFLRALATQEAIVA